MFSQSFDDEEMRTEESVVKIFLLCLSALIVLALPGVASADTFTFIAPPSRNEPTGPGSGPNQVDLDHHRAYSWSLGNRDSNGRTVNLNGQQITSATLTFSSMRNWDANANRLFIHLIDVANGGTLQSSSGGVGTIRYVQDATGVPVTDIRDYFGTRMQNGQSVSTGNGLVNNGVGDTSLTSQSFSQTGSPNGANPLGAGWSFANGNYTYTFTQAQLQVLSAYFLNGNNFAFGFDSDCHFWNNGITFTMNTGATPTPEPATMALLGTGLAGLYYRRRRQQRKTQEEDAA